MDFVKIVKIGAGAGAAIVAADALGLAYGASAGIITLLSIQDTKKETLRVVVRRFGSFAAALVIAAACFSVLGYGPLAFSVFLLLFSGACMGLGMQEGISVNAVLVTHFLAERSMTAAQIGNELALLVIGAGIGVAFNLYIPGKKNEIRQKQRQIEGLMREILNGYAGRLCRKRSGVPCEMAGENGNGSENKSETESGNKSESGNKNESGNKSESRSGNSVLERLKTELERGEKSAYEEMENKLLSDTRYYLHYMNMRREQAYVLGRIEGDLSHLKALPPQAEAISGLMGEIADRFHEHNNAVVLLEKLKLVKTSMRAQPLPADREEFESRAVLFQILLELERFLAIKKEFVEDLSQEEIRRFWNRDSAGL